MAGYYYCALETTSLAADDASSTIIYVDQKPYHLTLTGAGGTTSTPTPIPTLNLAALALLTLAMVGLAGLWRRRRV
jgi:hypothetical protein